MCCENVLRKERRFLCIHRCNRDKLADYWIAMNVLYLLITYLQYIQNNTYLKMKCNLHRKIDDLFPKIPTLMKYVLII